MPLQLVTPKRRSARKASLAPPPSAGRMLAAAGFAYAPNAALEPRLAPAAGQGRLVLDDALDDDMHASMARMLPTPMLPPQTSCLHACSPLEDDLHGSHGSLGDASHRTTVQTLPEAHRLAEHWSLLNTFPAASRNRSQPSQDTGSWCGQVASGSPLVLLDAGQLGDLVARMGSVSLTPSLEASLGRASTTPDLSTPSGPSEPQDDSMRTPEPFQGACPEGPASACSMHGACCSPPGVLVTIRKHLQVDLSGRK